MSQKGIKVLVSLETAFRIVDSGESTALKRTKTPLWLLSMVLLVCLALGHKMISQTWPRNRKT